MFAKLSTLALALPLVSALTINPLTNAQSASSVTITWTASTQDPPYFSIELVNEFFHNTFAIANNIQTSLGQLTVTLPELQPDDHYSIEAISTNDVSDVLSQSGQFSVTVPTSTSTSATSTTSATSSTTSGTLSSVSTTPASTVSAVSASSSAASASPSTFNSSGAASFKLAGVVPAAALVLSALAGAAMVF